MSTHPANSFPSKTNQQSIVNMNCNPPTSPILDLQFLTST